MKVFISILTFFAFFGFAESAHAQSWFALCPQSTASTDFSQLCSLNVTTALPSVLTLILVVAIVLALFYLIWGGIKWITSGGDKGNVETARNHIIAVVIGLILVFLAWFIINFLLTTFFGTGLEGNGSISLPSLDTSGNSTAPTVVATPTPIVVTPTPTPAVEGESIQVEGGYDPSVTYEVEDPK